jgi:hypothetical protein
MTPHLPGLLHRVAGRRVLVVGDVILDEYIDGDAARISPEAPVPVLRFTAQRSVLGGAANTAANVASLGGHATLVGAIAADSAGAEVRRKCAAARWASPVSTETTARAPASCSATPARPSRGSTLTVVPARARRSARAFSVSLLQNRRTGHRASAARAASSSQYSSGQCFSARVVPCRKTR